MEEFKKKTNKKKSPPTCLRWSEIQYFPTFVESLGKGHRVQIEKKETEQTSHNKTL